MPKDYYCCSCMKDIGDVASHFYLNFRYQVPGSGEPEKVLVVAVCQKCAKQADDPAMFPVIEALTNMNIIRMEQEDLLFTPDKRADE